MKKRRHREFGVGTRVIVNEMARGGYVGRLGTVLEIVLASRYGIRFDDQHEPTGESWHNNHHHYMASARQGFFWWEIDITYYLLKMLSWCRVVWDLREPPKHIELIQPHKEGTSISYSANPKNLNCLTKFLI
jgi:hypothetical protein